MSQETTTKLQRLNCTEILPLRVASPFAQSKKLAWKRDLIEKAVPGQRSNKKRFFLRSIVYQIFWAEVSSSSVTHQITPNRLTWAYFKTQYFQLSIVNYDLLGAIVVMLKTLRLLLSARMQLVNNRRLALGKTKTTTEARQDWGC